MTDEADVLLTSYERGKLTRRQLLTALAVMSASGDVAGQPPTPGIVRPRTLDHINVQVADLARTEAFYRKLFGFPPFHALPGSASGFDLQGSYLSFQKSETPGKIDHFCVAVEGDYDIKQVAQELEAAGIKAPTAGAGQTGYIIDPDGVRIQLWPEKDRLSLLPLCPPRA